MPKHYPYFLFVLFLLSLFLIYFTKPNIVAKIYQISGEVAFLTFHNYPLSIKLLETSKKFNDQDFYTWYLLGRVYFVNNELFKSTLSYNRSIELNENFKESYYGRGLTLGFTSEYFYDEAARNFQRYIELDNMEYLETGRHAYGAWAGYNDLAWIYFMQGKFEEAEIVTRDGLEISTSNPWLSNILGVLLLEKGNCEEAKVHLKNADYLMSDIATEEFGEAYSGDNPNHWGVAKGRMEKSIKENLKLCNVQN